MQEREAIRWLQLTYKVPSEPSQKRVWVWRRLQSLGAFALQNSVYLLPFSEEVEKQFSQLAQDIHEMGGEACLFSVFACDLADEQRILQGLIEARHAEYHEVIVQSADFLAGVQGMLVSRERDKQRYAEFACALEKIHVLFRSAKRHDLLGNLTATKRATAAECLILCEQSFRFLLDHDDTRVRHVLELHGELFSADTLMPASSLQGRAEQKRVAGESK
jgi:CRISPR/Cas system-associated endoribonuclease Cas2